MGVVALDQRDTAKDCRRRKKGNTPANFRGVSQSPQNGDGSDRVGVATLLAVSASPQPRVQLHPSPSLARVAAVVAEVQADAARGAGLPSATRGSGEN